MKNPFNRQSQKQKRITTTSVELQRLGIENLPGEHDTRVVHLNPLQAVTARNHCSNAVHTAKYNVVTFLPRFLFEQFTQVAYAYFLIQACLVWWGTVSPFKPFGPVLALCFVLVVGALKAIAEDRRRHVEDTHLNNSVAHVLNADGSTSDVKWSGVKVGQVLKVLNDEDFPADLLCLYCDLEDNVCFIKTTGLDGETNLKVRRPLNAKGAAPKSAAEAVGLSATLACEPPNPNLHYFLGRCVVQSGANRETVAVTMDEVLLRGCTLKNSGFVVGLVVYTGSESRIQMNAAAPPRKLGSYTRFLNIQVAVVIALQLLLCCACAAGALAWRENSGKLRYYLALTNSSQGNYSSNVAFFFVYVVTFWLLFSYLVPISLFVTIEIVKFIQGNFINNDPEMLPAGTTDWAKARNTNIIEDLGRVTYVFSDKTGTLTSNEMRMRAVAIKGIPYGGTDFRLEDFAGRGEAALSAFDPRLAAAAGVLQRAGFWEETLARGGSRPALLQLARTQSNTPPESLGLRRPEGQVSSRELVLGHHVMDFWTAICVCHNLIVEGDAADGSFRYQGPSPDEVALVEGARKLGFEFRGRTRSHLTINFQGREVVHEILVELPFSSERARMSVVARAPDSTIRLLCKGSDAVMLPLLRAGTDEAVLAATDENLHTFSVKGLRTLVIASKVLEPEQWDVLQDKYAAAAAALDDREARIGAVAAQLETEMELLGVTAIEDKLQEGVPEAISTLIEGGMRVWMITGDKQETAINIGISAGLVSDASRCLVCNADGVEAAAKRLAELAQQLGRDQGPLAGTASPPASSVNGSPANSNVPSIQRADLYGGGGSTSGTPSVSHSDSDSLVGAKPQPSRRPELVIDGRTLGYLLGTPAQEQLALVAAGCASVIVCRASPSQKASVVRMMRDYELKAAERGSRWSAMRWIHRQRYRMNYKMLSIGDGANDVAMIQTADIGVGVMGKEGRQAVNNSDFAIAQFRFIVRLLMVHGSLSVYRLARLIKYSFYKNIAFAAMLFFFQPFAGWSGQAVVDGISASFYNAFFTAFPIGFFSVLDRPFRSLDTYMRFPQLYNRNNPLRSRSFWKTGIAMGVAHGAAAFYIVYYSAVAAGRNSTNDLNSAGKTMYVALLTAVSAEIGFIARYWTWEFCLCALVSYALVFIFLIILPLLELAFHSYDQTLVGVAVTIMGTWLFWFQCLSVLAVTFGTRMLDRVLRTTFRPNDYEIVAEAENRHPKDAGLGISSIRRLSALSAAGPIGDARSPGDGSPGPHQNGMASAGPGGSSQQLKHRPAQPTTEVVDGDAAHV